MKSLKHLLSCVALAALASACGTKQATDYSEYSQDTLDYLGIKDVNYLSAASKRALERGYYKNAEWFGRFSVENLTGDFAYEKGVIRRDPSKVLKIDGRYYTWYTKSIGPGHGFETGDPDKKVFPWDKSEVWYASSADGYHWKEEGLAVGLGPTGSYDDRSVFTPEVMAHDGKYYLVYQTVKAPYLLRTYNQIGMAVADNPHGPWTKLAKPILSPSSETGEWKGEKDDRFAVVSQGEWDSHKVHDPTLMYYKDKFYLYYKGERKGEKITMGGREIRWGVAIADNIEGPYVKSKYNPITQSGHELAIWHYDGGIAMVSGHDGPEKETIQWAKDGINFEIMAVVNEVPPALGLVESLDTEKHPTEALRWGLSHKYVRTPGKSWLESDNYITRFTFSPIQKKRI
ncbi:glycoside hydrolase family 117 protein [Gayadomonas joobiniege]|uniref:glycoside hydrolase family 117 protein n=1 Tax=Gayadomonas joobiniege TaxID=1234606 RepID=UPI000366B710|nr:family 43 glycosylhydrolase [Gayadomonas joobiniege]